MMARQGQADARQPCAAEALASEGADVAAEGIAKRFGDVLAEMCALVAEVEVRVEEGVEVEEAKTEQRELCTKVLGRLSQKIMDGSGVATDVPLLAALRCAGGLPLVVRKLRRRSGSNGRGYDDASTVAALRVLCEVMDHDEDGAVEAAELGVFQKCMHLVGAEDEVVADLAARCLAKGVVQAGRHRAMMAGGEEELAEWREARTPQHFHFAYSLGDDAQDGVEDGVDTWIRTVPDAQESQYTVGYRLWSAAVILPRHLLLDSLLRAMVTEANAVLELGAGLGLTGLALAHACATAHDSTAEVTLTDFNPIVLRNLRFNVALNGLATSSPTQRVHVRKLDWTALPGATCLSTDATGTDAPSASSSSHGDEDRDADEEPDGDGDECVLAPTEMSGAFDLIVGTDIICQRSDAFNVANAIHHCLSPPPARAFVVCPKPENRFGVDSFPDALRAAGLHFTSTPVAELPHAESVLLADLDDSDIFAWDLFVIERQPG